MKKEELIKIINNMECEDITLSHLKSLFITTNKNYDNFYVYIFYKESDVMYVGQTTNLRKRFINHFRDMEYEIWKSEITKVEIFELDTYSKMMSLESRFIDILSPIYNKKEHLPSINLNSNYNSYYMSKEELMEFIQPTEIKYSDILDKLEEAMNNGIDRIILKDWLECEFYFNSNQQTINTCYDNIKQKILNLCSKYNYILISKRGKGNKSYIEKN